jgi:5-hydroxyisourate hydrolase-like protein (transthyretin family)
VVPSDGRLNYENVELLYGLNDFEIRLYGPFGEEDTISNRINVKRNPLAKGQSAYSLNVLDKNHRLFNDDSDDPYQLTNIGGSYNYGVSDRWQLGVSFASIDSDQQFYSIKNALSFNNFLLENDFAVNQDGSYAQKSSMVGSLFQKDSYSLVFESAKDFTSEEVNAADTDFYSFSGNYALRTFFGFTRFGIGYEKYDYVNRTSLTNQISKNIWGVNFSHTLKYFRSEFLDRDLPETADNLTGNLNVSANLPAFLLSASISYDPDSSDPILDNSSISIRKRLTDPFENKHYISALYFPISQSDRKWSMRHNVSWQSKKFQMTLASSYDSLDNWDVQLGVQFFLGYDHRNNRFIMDKYLSPGTATLDVHTYLDRHVNGKPDVLDYDLPDVSFTGHPRWEDDFLSNEQGRTILPGVYGNSEFAFAANWQEGSATINQDYVVYTHPGAYVDVNMPFYLITDLTGFVVRQQSGEEIGLRNVKVNLVNDSNEVLKTVETDQDGYYEFIDLGPNSYRVQIEAEYLQEKGLSGESVGFNIKTGGRGGYVELPTIVLQRLSSNTSALSEKVETFIISEDNIDALVWSEDETEDKNYFTLPRKDKGQLVAQHSLTQEPQPTKEQTAPKAILQAALPSIQAPPNNSIILPQEKPQGIVLTQQGVASKVLGVKSSLPQIKIKRPTSSSTAPVPVAVNNRVETGFVIDDAPIELSELWVVQFSANTDQASVLVDIEKFKVMGDLYVGQKTNGNGTIFYCVISEGFSSKQTALNSLNSSGLSGWVTSRDTYVNIQQTE